MSGTVASERASVYDGIGVCAEDIGGSHLRAYIQQTAAEVRAGGAGRGGPALKK